MAKNGRYVLLYNLLLIHIKTVIKLDHFLISDYQTLHEKISIQAIQGLSQELQLWLGSYIHRLLYFFKQAEIFPDDKTRCPAFLLP